MRTARGVRLLGVLIGLGMVAGGASLAAQDTKDEGPPAAGADDGMPKPGAKGKSKTSKGRRSLPKKGTSKPAADSDDMPAPAAKGEAAAADDGSVKFSRDIAPILVGNCIGCHNPKDKARRKNFDQTTFAALMKGGDDGEMIVPGKPEESQLILRIRGEETPKMPPGQRNLGPKAIAKIEAWIKAGAILDKGIEPTAELAKVAPSPDKIRRDQIAKLSTDERDKKAEAVALDRWKKASSKTTPEMSSDKHFLLFGNLPKERAKNTLKAMETQYNTLGRMLGPAANNTALAGPEKISIYVFKDSNAYIEFVRALEMREADAGEEGNANFGVETPYLAVVDPLNGGEEPASSGAASKKSARTKKAEEADEAGGPARSLVGILAENLAIGALGQAGKPPRWLTLGLGAYLGSQVEGRSPYYRQLRAEAYATFDQGGQKVREALGGEGEAMRIRAVGFSMLEWLAANARATLPAFVRELAQGGEKLDEAARVGFGMTPEDFMNNWRAFVGQRYGRGR